ncbi:hypothetical protein NP493_3457g00000 [Ridgeia piscesae]|uniref:Uncharacterized protein n=1 Tax=Ridgeia piscesae TaxID=27915 RepID=A0AAD9J664_RIDPI|nr:hypothetical protein NP493_3457g00000 [Ridgeia piscesae]
MNNFHRDQRPLHSLSIRSSLGMNNLSSDHIPTFNRLFMMSSLDLSRVFRQAVLSTTSTTSTILGQRPNMRSGHTVSLQSNKSPPSDPLPRLFHPVCQIHQTHRNRDSHGHVFGATAASAWP